MMKCHRKMSIKNNPNLRICSRTKPVSRFRHFQPETFTPSQSTETRAKRITTTTAKEQRKNQQTSHIAPYARCGQYNNKNKWAPPSAYTQKHIRTYGHTGTPTTQLHAHAYTCAHIWPDTERATETTDKIITKTTQCWLVWWLDERTGRTEMGTATERASNSENVKVHWQSESLT